MAAEHLGPVPYHHVTVMTFEVLFALDPRPGGVYLDATVGGGGHAEAILSHEPEARVIAFDRDPAAVHAARQRLLPFGSRAMVECGTFGEVRERLAALSVGQVDGIVADLGVSSAQLDDAERGMGFRRPGPLDMRMGPDAGETARALMERLSQDALADLLYQLGEERRSRRVAACIKQALDAGALETTHDLRRAVVRAVGPRRVGGVDPATRTFRALRIAVNRELEELSALLEAAPTILRGGATLVVISFHSLEDRLVKRALLERASWRRLTKKPLVPTSRERTENPRSRSAKLRAARRRREDDELSPPPPIEEVL